MPVDYHFLSDQPLKEETELQNANFGHKDIAQTLVSIIKNCKSPFSIALDGKWGSGKSSVANLVLESLKKQENFSIVYFDIWKYEGDALRRSFLKEAVIQLKKESCLGSEFVLNERLYSSLTVEAEGNITLGKGAKFFKQIRLPIFIGIIIFSLLTAGFKYLNILSEFWDVWKTLLLFFS